MKKALFATSALVAAGLAGSATAAEWSSSVNGYWYVGMAYSESDRVNAVDGAGILRDGEIHFNASLKADNGLTFKSRVELESFTSGDQIDENWASVSGAFGTVKFGGDDSASYNNNVGVIYAPGARIGYYDTFIINSQDGTEFIGPAGSGDGLGVHYTTPSFSGFSAGISYIPNSGADGAADTNNPSFEVDNRWSVGANFSTEVDGFGFGISGGYTDQDGANNDAYTVGANISVGGFTVAGTFEDDQTEEIAFGAQYSADGVTFGGGYAKDYLAGENSEVGAVWVTVANAPGVSTTLGLEYTDNASNDQTYGGMMFFALKF